jgi:hypothetical protein
MTTNRPKIECRTDNRRLAQWRVTWLIEHSPSHQLLRCIDSFVLRNPPERKARKRYLSFQIDTPKDKINKEILKYNEAQTDENRRNLSHALSKMTDLNGRKPNCRT